MKIAARGIEKSSVKRFLRFFSVLFFSQLIFGCVGMDAVLFTTRTTVGIDADTTPPTLEIVIGREESVIEPAFQDGKTLPVLSSADIKAGFLNFGASQSFATGDAAIVMGKMLTKPGRYSLGAEEGVIRTTPYTPLFFQKGGKKTPKKFPDRRPLFFGTKTKIGLYVEFNEAQVPSAFSLGYKRKELAVAPLIEKQAIDNQGTPVKEGNQELVDLKLVSLLATIGTEAKAKRPEEAGVSQYSQLFATGEAATALAQHEEVRQVLGRFLIPESDAIQKIAKERKVFQDQVSLFNKIVAEFTKRPKSNQDIIVDVAVKNTMLTASEGNQIKGEGDVQRRVGSFRRLLSEYVDRTKPERAENLGKLQVFSESLP